tara:strand:+ start:24 stop:1409 length:1386 start_codon:yes stop_codon:yes gene_type:complete
MPRINDYLQGFQNGLPGMKDYRHASRLYIDDNFKLMPKQKFLFHVVFNLDEEIAETQFTANERTQLNMLVKAADLPRYGYNVEEKIQYNKKMYTATRIQYEPVNITFHDDHADTVNAFWKKYYEYTIADGVSMNSDLQISATKDDYYKPEYLRTTNRYGLDTPKQRGKPYIKGIEIFVLHKQRFTSMTLVNPVIGSFAHDQLDQADGAGVMQNTMQIFYETVLYKSGIINVNNVPGFATINYDKEPSPLTVLGGGTNSIFGPGGVVDGIGSVIKNVRSGNILGAILSASNTYNNAKKIKKKDAKEELKGIAKKGVLEIGKQAGTTSPVSQFAIGAAIATGVTIANKKGTNDNTNKADVKVLTNTTLDTNTFLTADESFKLVNNDDNVKDEVAAGLYYKDIGSRKNLTVAESDVEFENASDNVKTVYRSKALTNIRKLVTEGYLRINRTSQDVSISVEKATL